MLSIRRVVLALIAGLIALVLLPGWLFGALASLGLLAAFAIQGVVLLARADRLPRFLERAGHVLADRPTRGQSSRPYTSQARTTSAAAAHQTPSSEPQAAPDWDETTFTQDMLARFLGADVIDDIADEVSGYFESTRRHPFFCLVSGPKESGKSALLVALERAFAGQGFPVEDDVAFDAVDWVDLGQTPGMMVVLLDSLAVADLNPEALNTLEKVKRSESPKLVFLFVTADALRHLPQKAQNLVDAKIALRPFEPGRYPDLLAHVFVRLLADKHDIALKIPETEDMKFHDFLAQFLANNPNLTPGGFKSAIDGEVRDLIAANGLQSGQAYLLTAIPRVRDGASDWQALRFEEAGDGE